jgi:hypothetical protein
MNEEKQKYEENIGDIEQDLFLLRADSKKT